MQRLRTPLLAAVLAALCLSGCGADGTVLAPAGVLDEPAAGAPVAIEPTDGRLGGATIVRAGARPRELSRGGPLDARRRGDGPRRDGVGAGAGCPSIDLAPGAGSMAAISAATLCLVNGERADRGLASLAPNAKLAAAAAAHAQDLVDGSYFSHTGRDGSSSLARVKRSGYITPGAGYVVGENLAWGTGALATPGSIMQAWMNSPGHRKNLLNPDFRELGVGIAPGNPAARNGLGATYATEFGVLEGAAAARPAVAATPSSSSARSAKKRKRARRARQARRVQARAAARAAR